MYPMLIEELAREHLRELHREAAGRRLAGGGVPRPRSAGGLRRAVGGALIAVGSRVAGAAAMAPETGPAGERAR